MGYVFTHQNSCDINPHQFFIVQVDQNLKAITEQVNTDTTYTLTYTDGTPLSTADEMYILKEKKAKRIELVEMDKDNSRVRIYKCQNGLIFKGTRN